PGCGAPSPTTPRRCDDRRQALRGLSPGQGRGAAGARGLGRGARRPARPAVRAPGLRPARRVRDALGGAAGGGDGDARPGAVARPLVPARRRLLDQGQAAAGAPAGRGTAPVNVDAARALALGLADDELVLGYRESEWTGVAPLLEEDVALSSI